MIANMEKGTDPVENRNILPVDLWTVFLVDDNNDDLYLGERVLRHSPFIQDVVCVQGPEQLVYELRSRHFFYDDPGNPPNSLIILDIHMPEKDGIEVLNDLRSNPYTENIPIVMLTGDVQTENIEKTYKMAANGYIQKPLNDNHLAHIHRILKKGRNWRGSA